VLEQFLNHIKKHQLFSPEDKVLLAVSGGLDSMVMLHIFIRAGFSVGVAHCNFQLRGAESDGDEKFVARFCQSLKIPFYSKRFEARAMANENGISIQMAARELRYNWFEELLIEENYSRLATAHHSSDSVETILLSWINGASIDGLLGIPVKNGNIIRPLLFATRAQLESYAKDAQLTWREDSSNDSIDYRRNYIRHRIIPHLSEVNPSFESTIMRGQEKLKGEYELLSIAFQEWKNKYVEYSDDTILIAKKGFEHFSSGASILWRLINHLGFNFDECLQIMEALEGQPGKQFMGTAHELNIDRDQLIIFPQKKSWEEVILKPDQELAILGTWTMNLRYSNRELTVIPTDPYEVVLDAEKIAFPLRWRQWKSGDYFYPLGMNHRKKLSDFLIDEKVSMAEKSRVTVLESQGQIIWVPGYRPDNRFRVTTETKRVLLMIVRPYFD
jgi:tRNA(Ile)-lysidine synthase